jgi:large subunit ribosomal protein L17
MRHLKHRHELGVKKAHRSALMANLACALIKEGRIKTTLSKAKALRPFIEKLITLAKHGSLADRRLASSRIRSKEAVQILFNEKVEEFTDRPGGYTRIYKIGNRIGDAAEMAYIELIPAADEGYGKKKKKKAKKTAKKTPLKTSEKSAVETIEEPATVTEEPAAEVEGALAEPEELAAEEVVAETEEVVAEVEEPVAEAKEAVAEVEEAVTEVEEPAAKVEEAPAPVAEEAEEKEAVPEAKVEVEKEPTAEDGPEAEEETKK